MATSGTVSTTVFNTRRVIDRAFGRCKVGPQQITSERIEIAKDLLFLALAGLVNRGVLLWAIDKQIVPLYEGQAQVDLPVGTVDSLNASYRELSRLTGTYATSAGGTIANVNDDDFTTLLTQTAADGNVSADFTTATQVTTVGVLPGTTATWSLVFERSADAVTWTTVLAVGSAAYVSGTWAWYDLDGALAARYFRVRETGGGTLSLRELFLGNTPAETPLGRLNQDDYTALPNKTFGGRPLQFWMNRLADQPTVHLWPVTDAAHRYGQLVVWRQRYVQDVGTLAQQIEVPQRWYPYVVARLAADLAGELPEVDDAKEVKLISVAERAWSEAQNEERDASPMMLTPQINVYTR